MRSLTLVLVTLLLASSALADTPAVFWGMSRGGTGTDNANDVEFDASGNMYLTGEFAATVDFGGGPLVSAGSADVFLVKYDADGNHLWSQRFGSTLADEANELAVDAAGNVYLAGFFNGTVSFGGTNLISAGDADVFVAKYNSNGTFQWSQRHGSTGADVANAIDADDAGNVVVTGAFSGTASFGGANLVSVGSFDVFMAKYNTSGAHQWSQRFGSTDIDQGNAVHIGPSGEVFLTGAFTLSVSFGGPTFTSAGSFDIFQAKYNSSGTHQWSYGIGGASSDSGQYVVADAAGNVTFCGPFNLTINFGGGPLTATGQDGFVVRYNASGVHQWSKNFGDGANAAAQGPYGVVVVRFFSGTADFGGGPIVGVGSNEMYLVQLDNTGAHQLSTRIGSTSTETALAVDTDSWGNVILAGVFNSASISVGDETFVNAGGNDMLLAKFGPRAAEPILTSIVDVGNDQGRNVAIRCVHSGYDSRSSSKPIVQYEAFRRNDSVSFAIESATEETRTRISAAASTPTNWVFVSAIPAHGAQDYIALAPTAADSTVVDGQHFSAFFIRAATSDPFTFFDSDVDSGYSVDNLAPSAPSNLVYASGDLAWAESRAADFDYFTVYGSAIGVLDGSATVIGHTTATMFDVSTNPFVYYHVTATDFSGNEGRSAKVSSTTDVGDGPSAFALAINAHPNPFNPSTTIRYDVPSRGRAVVSVYDVRGAFVATLVDEHKEVGSHSVRWNGVNAAGTRTSSGIYFVTVDFQGMRRTTKAVLLK